MVGLIEYVPCGDLVGANCVSLAQIVIPKAGAWSHLFFTGALLQKLAILNNERFRSQIFGYHYV